MSGGADLDNLAQELQRRLTPKSWDHSTRIAEVAAELAAAQGEDVEKARLAALAHDIARDYSDSELLSLAESHGHKINQAELQRPYLVHAAVGARLLRIELDIEDEEVLQAVRRHTFGAPGMTKLDKIVYLANAIEPKRDFSGVEQIREIAPVDIDSAFASLYKMQFRRLIEKDKVIHPMTLDVWNHFCVKR